MAQHSHKICSQNNVVKLPKTVQFFHKTKLLASLGLCLGALLLVTNVFAHHSYKSNFDNEKKIQITGTVVEYKAGYPHTYIVLHVIDRSENSSLWTVETHSPNLLERFNWDENTFSSGDQLEIQGTPSRSAGNYVRLLSVTMPDGEVVKVQKH